MAISDEISRLQTAKTAIKLAISLKGVEIPDGVTLSYYDTYISQIETQGTYEIKTVTPDALGQTVTPSEGYDALSQVIINGDLNLTPQNIADGVTIFGVTGTLQATPKLQTKNVTPSASYQEVKPDDGYDGLSLVGVNGDGNLIPSNIRKGASIFGVSGSFAGGGTSSNYNVYSQAEEPTEKNGIWIKSGGGSNNVYFSQNMTSQGEIIDGGNFAFLNSPNKTYAQIVVGDYLYSFDGTNPSKYNLRTKELVGGINFPTNAVTLQAYYYKGKIYVAGGNIGIYIYDPDIDYTEPFISVGSENTSDVYYFACGFYSGEIYLYTSTYYQYFSPKKINLDTLEVTSIPRAREYASSTF